jgi:glycosyltransferase involved in cell wall biosynthesis
MPRVSVIIPTYNRATLVKRALESVLAQRFQDFEVIVADDGSTDDTAAVVAAYAPRVKLLSLPHSGLPSVARNAALREASGELIAFLDSDDQCLPERIERQVEVLAASPQIGLACSNAVVERLGQGKAAERYLRAGQGKSGRVLPELLRDNFVITSTATVRRAILERTGPFCENPRLRAREDYDLWLRVAAVAEVHYDADPLAIYRDDVGSVREGEPRSRYWEGMILVLGRLQSYLEKSGPIEPPVAELLRELDYARRRALCESCWAERRFRDLATCYVHLLRRHPAAAVRFGGGQVLRALRRLWGGAPAESAELIPSGGTWLHLGCGEVYLRGYVNVDFPRDQHPGQKRSVADLYADITKLSYAAGSVDEVRLHHVFEHFDRATAIRLLIDWYGWLREGGRLRIETPDFERCIRALRWKGPEAQQRVLRHLFGSQEAPWAVHYDGWYERKFSLYLTSLGFTELLFARAEWHGIYSITVTATRRGPGRTREELIESGERLLRLYLVDDAESEQRMLEVWKACLRGAS